MAQQTSRQIKGYELREKIGEGGFGAVYRAYQLIVEREVAIKFILPEFANQPDFIRRFETEAQLVARLEHPHIVPLFDYWRDPEGAYLVMRWIRGGSLRESLRKNGIPDLRTTARLVDQISAALSLAHRTGIIHRDLKPDNILVDADGNAYLTDFGIAQLAGKIETEQSVSGTLDYISPEQLQGLPPSPAMDIYSLGIVLYELLQGEPPYASHTPAQKMTNHLYEPLPPVNHEQVSAVVNQVLAKATAKKPEQRYQDVRELSLEFQRALLPEERFSRTTVIMHTEPTNPYKGLRPFDEADAGDFFGREVLVEQMVAQISDDQRFMAVIGPSGSGKSSVVLAGVIPALRRGDIPGSENWFIATMVPGDQPLQNLVAALLSVATHPPTHLLDQLHSDPRGLLWAVEGLLAGAEGDLVLVIDQFEEIFTLVTDEAERVHFLELLTHAVQTDSTRLRIIITLRADFYDRPLLYEGFGALIEASTQVVLPLSASEVERAINGPAERAGLEVQTDLIAAIVSDLREQPGALPLLQYALTEVYEHRAGRALTLFGYQDSGGVSGALARRAEEVFGELTADQQSAARQMFLRLVTPGEGTEDTRRRAYRAELGEIADKDTIQTILDLFGRYRLLTFDIEPGTREPLVEVAHEALIRTWKRLREWLDTSRADIRQQRLLATAMTDWRDHKQESSFLLRGGRLAQFEEWSKTSSVVLTPDEQAYIAASVAGRTREEQVEKQRQQLLRGLVAVLSVLLLIAFGASLLAVNRTQVAQENESTAIAAVVTATNALGQSDINLREAWDTQALFLADLARQQLSVAPQVAVSLALESLVHLDEGIFHPESRAALYNAALYPVMETYFGRHDGAVNGALWNADQTQILSWSNDKTARIWDVNIPDQPLLLVHDAAVVGAKWNQDETKVITWATNGVIRLWDLNTPDAEPLIFRHGGEVRGVVWNNSEDQFVSWSLDNTVRVWHTADPADFTEILKNQKARSAAWSPDNSHIMVIIDGGSTVYVWDTAVLDQPLTLKHDKEVFGAAWGQDNARILTWSDKTALIWTLATPDEPLLLNHEGRVRGALWNSDQTRVLTYADDNASRIWDVATGEVVVTMTGTERLRGASWNAAETRVYSWANDRMAQVWDVGQGADGVLLNSLEHQDIVNDISLTADETRLLTVTVGGVVTIWDVETGAQLQVLPGANVTTAEWQADNTHLLTASLDGSVRVWLLNNPNTPPVLQHDDKVYNAIWSPDNTKIVTVSTDKTAKVWNSTDFANPTILQHDGEVYGITWNKAGTKFTTAAWDGTIRVWDINDLSEPEQIFRHEANTRVWIGIWSEDQTKILSWSEDNTARLWNLTSPEDSLVFQHDNDVNWAIMNRAADQVVTCGRDGVAKFWDLNSPDAEPVILPHDRSVTGAIWNSDETQFITWSVDGTAKLWTVSDLSTPVVLAHDMEVRGATWNKAETQIVTWSLDGRVKIWNVSDLTAPVTTLQHQAGVFGALWNKDESKMLTWSWDQTAKIWTLSDLENPVVLQHNDRLRGASWSADETRVLTWDWSGMLRLWNATNPADVMVFDHNSSRNIVILWAYWSNDQKWVLSASEDGTARLWLVDLPQLLDIGRSQVIHTLTNGERRNFFLPEDANQAAIATATLLPSLTPSLTPTPSNTPLPTETPTAEITATP